MNTDMTMLDAALFYAAQGMKVFPVYGIRDGKCTCGFPACKPPNSGKHPATANGLKNATTDEGQIRAWFASDRFNIAIATGADSKIYVLDIDGAQGEEALEALERAHTKLPATMESTTGRGRHLIFKHTGEEIRNSAGKIGMKLDWRGDGGYIVAPPSRHYSGVNYTLNGVLADYAPDWLMDLAKADKAKKVDAGVYHAPSQTAEWEIKDVRDMLAAIDPDMDYDGWVRVGMALSEGGYPVTLWDEWSRRGKKYQAGDCIKRYRSFNGGGVTMGTLVEKALEAGWTKERPVVEADPDAAAIGAMMHKRFMERQQQLVVIEKPLELFKEFPNPVDVPGLIGETVRWLMETSIKPQPELYLIHVIAALGAVFGRRFKGKGRLDTRTNIYMIGIAGTGSGKDHSRKQVHVLMQAAGLSEFMGHSQFKSDSGLVTALQKAPSQLMQIDEIGNVLGLISDKKAAGFLKNIATHLLTLYSTSGGFFSAGQYADKEKEAVIIPNPNLCIYGTTVEEAYAKSLNSDSIASGEMNRFIVIPVSEKIPKRNEDNSADTAPPQALVAKWEALRNAADMTAANSALITPVATVVVWNEDIGLRLRNMGEIEDQHMRDNIGGIGALWNRYRENVLKIAMIVAIARNQMRPEITGHDLDIAEGIVQKSVAYVTRLCSDSVADSEFQRWCQKILRYVMKEGQASQSKIYTANRFLKMKELKEVIEALEEQGHVEIYMDMSTPTAKKKAKIIRYVG